jgi:hypothetical protein
VFEHVQFFQAPPLTLPGARNIHGLGVILMSTIPDLTFSLETIALFPKKYFLENLAVRTDGSILVSAMNVGELWCVPNPTGKLPVKPILVDRIANLPMGIVEIEPDIFFICTLGEPTLERVDMRGWTPGAPVKRERVLTFPAPAMRLNGACLIGPNVLAIADCAAGLIWRVDFTDNGHSAQARIWLRHDDMAPGKDFQTVATSPKVTIPFPGVNGVRFAAETSYLYYTSSAQDLFVRVAVDPSSHETVGTPETIATGFRAADDFCLDEKAGFAYIGTHITNTIQRVPLTPSLSSSRTIVAGDPFNDQLIGPSSLVWASGATAHGRAAYVTTDGGFLAPPADGFARPAALLRFTIKEGAPMLTPSPA